MPSKTRLIIDVVFTLVFFFPLFGYLLDFSIRQAYHSLVIGELSSRGVAWQPILYPFRAIVPLGIALLLLQGLGNFSRDLVELLKGQN
jgi:TRAP-type mannitol/chloroaromatic compound transport system permease small subunit